MNSLLIDAIKNYKVKVINITHNKKSETPNEGPNEAQKKKTKEKQNEETDKKINKKVKKIYVINLIEDEIKRNYIIILMQKYNINFTLVIVERVSTELYKSLSDNSRNFISKGELGCCLSHLWCLSQIIKNNYENAIIFEDDIILHKDFENEFIDIYNNCTSNNNKLDFMLLGAHDYNFSKNNFKYAKNKIYRPDEPANNPLYGAHANYYSLKGAKAMFKIRTSIISFFDKEYMLMFNYFKNSSYICYPNLVVSNVSSSALNHKREILSQMEYEYYNKCFIKFNFNNYNFIYLNLLVKDILASTLNSSTKLPTTNSNDAPMERSILNLAGCKIDENNNDYESFVDNSLYHIFNDLSKINMVKKRLVMNFYNLHDMQQIFNLQQ